MSVDVPDAAPKVELSKEEKRQRKAAKKARREAAAAASREDGTEIVKEKKEKSNKKEKDDGEKKRKRADEETVDGTSDEVKTKKEKKDKKDKKDKADTPAQAAASTPNGTADTKSSAVVESAEPFLSKKAQKKAAKAAAAASSSNPAPLVTPSAFTTEHNAYLATHNITLLPPLFPPHLIIPTLPIPAPLLQYLTKFTSPTPIQACSWPALLGGRDVVGIAETGSGKTLAFGVPALNHLHSRPAVASKKGKGKSQVGVLVLAPTRELAQQSHENLSLAGKSMGVESTCIFGGVPKEPQTRDLARKEVRIVVGTPGRTLDLADSGDLDLSNVSYLVLDEADRMLDQGFENDIRRIIAHCPGHEAGRQTVMFSATWPESVRRLASTFLRDPIRVTVGSDELSANKRIEQIVEVLDDGRQKDPRLLYHLRAHLKAHPSTPEHPTRILVFALYKKEAQRLELTMRKAGYSIAGLHGDLSQDARFKALEKFKTGQVNVLVATDVAARGLDIPDVGLVLNVTFPLTTEDFVHRCGRTGRAGKSGKAVTFFTGEGHERALAGEFMRVLRDVGAEIPKEMDRFPSTIKKKEHGSYGAFYRDTTNAPPPTKITFD